MNKQDERAEARKLYAAGMEGNQMLISSRDEIFNAGWDAHAAALTRPELGEAREIVQRRVDLLREQAGGVDVEFTTALSQLLDAVPRWVDDLPTEEGTYLVTVELPMGNPVTPRTPKWSIVKQAAWMRGEWWNRQVTERLRGDVIAYMPQPSAYQKPTVKEKGERGMSEKIRSENIRREMATQILAGLMANPERYKYVVSRMDKSLSVPEPWSHEDATRHNAEKAVYLADALLAALKKE